MSSRVDFVPLFVPGVTGGPTLEGLLQGENRLNDIITASPSNISPTTDDRPFFYQFEWGIPESLWPLLWGLGAVVLAGLIGVVAVQRRVAETPARYVPIYLPHWELALLPLKLF